MFETTNRGTRSVSVEDALAEERLMEALSGESSGVHPFGRAECRQINANLATAEAENNLKLSRIISCNEHPVHRVVDSRTNSNEVRQWQLVLHCRSQCAIGREIRICPLVLVARVAVLSDRISIGRFLAISREGRRNRQRRIQLARFVDSSSTGLAEHNWLALEDKPLGLIPGQVAVGRSSHCLIEVAKHRLPDGDFPQVVHVSIISGILQFGEKLAIRLLFLAPVAFRVPAGSLSDMPISHQFVVVGTSIVSVVLGVRFVVVVRRMDRIHFRHGVRILLLNGWNASTPEDEPYAQHPSLSLFFAIAPPKDQPPVGGSWSSSALTNSARNSARSAALSPTRISSSILPCASSASSSASRPASVMSTR